MRLTLEDVRPRGDARTDVQLYRLAVANVDCPRCKSARDVSCKSPRGTTADTPHLERVDLALAQL